jgi:hypothetical protein
MFWPDLKFPPINLYSLPRQMTANSTSSRYVKCKTCQHFDPFYPTQLGKKNTAGSCSAGVEPLGFFFLSDDDRVCDEHIFLPANSQEKNNKEG